MRLRTTTRELAAAGVVLVVACGGTPDSTRGVLSAGGSGGMLASGGVTAMGGTGTGGVSSSSGGVVSTPVPGSLGGYGGAASGFCPTLNFGLLNPPCTGSGACTLYPFSSPGCCLPSGECGGLLQGVPVGPQFPPDGCDTYAQIQSFEGFRDVPSDPHQVCGSGPRDGGADTSTDASTPMDASRTRDSSARDSAGDEGG